MTEAKICGIKDRAGMDAVIVGEAAMAGLMFYGPSPRYLALDRAAELARYADGRIPLVGVFVDPDDSFIAEVVGSVGLDYIQLHGQESEARVLALKTRFGLPVIKAIPIADADDITRAHGFEDVVDMLLFDAKPPKGDDYMPGGNALHFDWTLIAHENWGKPWMLSGGLTAENVVEAIAASGARAVDVSSGVESAKGVKDPAKIRAFLEAVHGVETPE